MKSVTLCEKWRSCDPLSAPTLHVLTDARDEVTEACDGESRTCMSLLPTIHDRLELESHSRRTNITEKQRT
ncbi:hypothetical protein C0Q70_04013 [Pomacea canaliculata]|uniref:Uncharacterized protein n=1 Tax=Pomacea canaliculata TaxID=400727 RepID=A0A2T7PUF0_POMCA|nr:hypothetical protein C0Q70_04013 [Pomacea canaliculata]